MIDNNCDNNDIQIYPHSINVSNCSKYYLAFVITNIVSMYAYLMQTLFYPQFTSLIQTVISFVLLVRPREVKLNLNPT